MKISGIEVVVQFCVDPEKSQAWYADFLGLETTKYPSPLFVLEGATLLLAPGAPGTGRGGTGVYFNVESVDEAYKELTARGYRFNEAPYDVPVGRLVTTMTRTGTSSGWRTGRRVGWRAWAYRSAGRGRRTRSSWTPLWSMLAALVGAAGCAPPSQRRRGVVAEDWARPVVHGAIDAKDQDKLRNFYRDDSAGAGGSGLAGPHGSR